MFNTKYILLYTHQPEDIDQLLKRRDEVDKLLNNEIEKMKKNIKMPLFLVVYCGTNNYIAWSLNKKKYICVYDYKAYRKKFRISEYNCYDRSTIKNNDKYGIIPPSETLIKSLGLDLDSKIWENKMSWDKWEKRKEKDKKKNIPEEYQDTYGKVINLINQGRSNDYKEDNAFAKLESRVARFEKLNELLGPKKIIEKEVKLIKESIEEIGIKMLVSTIQLINESDYKREK